MATADYSVSIQLGGEFCIVPRPGIDVLEFVRGKANSYTCPVGPVAGRGWVLMDRKRWEKVKREKNPNKNAVEVIFRADKTVIFPRMFVFKVRRATRGHRQDPNSVLLIEFGDVRGINILEKPSSGFEHFFGFNIRKENPTQTATGTDLYHTDSLDAGVLWTWSRMTENLWEQMDRFLGDYPGLPYTPDATPEHFIFISKRGTWHALTTVLNKLRCAVAYNPLTDKFRIVELGAEQTGLAKTEAALQFLYDAETEVFDVTSKPRRIVTAFQNRDTPWRTSWRDLTDAPEIEDFVTKFNDDGTGDFIVYDDLWAELNTGAVLPPSNAAALSSRTDDIGDHWEKDMDTPHGHVMYPGVVRDILPGEQVKIVSWRFFGRDGNEGGFVTEVLKQPGIPDQLRPNDLPESFSGVVLGAENLEPPNHARRMLDVPPDFLIGRADADIERGTSGTISIWEGEGSGEVDSGENLVAFDWLNTGAGADDKVYVFLAKEPEFDGPGLWYFITVDQAQDECCAHVREVSTATTIGLASTPIIHDTEDRSDNWWTLDATTGEIEVFGVGEVDIHAGQTFRHSSTTIANGIAAELQHQPFGGAFATILGTTRRQNVPFGTNTDLSIASIETHGPATIGAAGDRVRIVARTAISVPAVATVLNEGNLSVCPCPGFKFLDSLSKGLLYYLPQNGQASYGAAANQWGDATSNGRHFTETVGSPHLVVAGPTGLGKAHSMSASGDRLDLPSEAAIQGAQDFSIRVIVKIATGSGFTTILKKSGEYTIVYDSGSDRFQWSVDQSGGGFFTVDANAFGAVPKDVFLDVIVTWKESTKTAQIFVNDTKDSGVATFGGTTGAAALEYQGGVNADDSDGAFWSRVVTDAEVSTLFGGGTFIRPVGVT